MENSLKDITTETLKDLTSGYDSNVKSFFSDNKVWLAALGGAAAGIAIATLINSEKGRTTLNRIGETAGQWANQVKQNVNKENLTNLYNKVANKAQRETTVQNS